MPQLDILIQKSDIEPYAQMSRLIVEEEQLHPFILAAQNLDLKPVLGNAFWTDLITNRLNTNYATLLEGGNYTVDTDTLSFAGLKAALAEFTMARYILGKNVQDAPFGMMVKESDYGSPAGDKALAQAASPHTMAGQQYLQECICFLEANESTYPVYKSSKVKTDEIKGTIRITGVSRF